MFALFLVSILLPMDQSKADTTSKWNGFEKRDFVVAGRKAFVVVPERAAVGRPWIWRTEFFGHEPQADIALVKKGFHAAYIDVQDLYGAPKALDAMDALYDHLTREYGLSKKTVLEGFSRGGLFTLNWAARHPDRVACIYNDAPVCDFKSWPLGQGAGKSSPGDWQKCLKAYGFTQKQALDYDKNPVDNLKPLAEAKIPILHVCGDADEVVPFGENTMLLYRRYRQMDGPMEVIAKPGVKHHPHSLKDPAPIVDFILKHAPVTGLEDAAAKPPAVPDNPEEMQTNARLRGTLLPSRRKFAGGTGHVAFLGGSITEMDGYRPIVMDQLRRRYPNTKFTFTNAGVSSTCSTTGAFRLAEDVLAKGPVDLLLVEFAVNDDQDAHHARRECVRGMEGIIRHVRRHNPQAVIIMVHFVNEGMLAKLAKGEEPLSSGAHEEVAQRYGVSTVQVGRELNRRIQAKTMDWKQYGGVHPAKAGNQMAADLVRLVLDQAEAIRSESGQVTPYPLTDPLDPNSYERGNFLPNSSPTLGEGWELSKPPWPQLKGECRPRFRNLDLLWTQTPGAMMTAPFTGRTLGAYVLAGPDAGTVEVSIDGGPFNPVPLKHPFSGGLHYPRTVILAGGLADGKHTARIRLAKADQATAARIVRLAVD